MAQIPAPNLKSVEEMRQWIRKHWHKTILTNVDKDTVIAEIFGQIVADSPLVENKSVRTFMLNDSEKRWKEYCKSGRVTFQKDYYAHWSFNKISWFVLNKFIKYAMYFEERKNKKYITFATQIPETLYDEIKKMQTSSLSALFHQMIHDFSSLTLKEQKQWIGRAKRL